MSSLALFGKIPQAPDFIRRGISTQAMRDLENWFHSAYTELRGAGARGLMHACRLILPHRNGADGVLAVLAVPSRDRIGREFPVVVAVSVPRDKLPQRSAPLVFAFTRFWDAARAVVDAHCEGDPDALWESIERLSPPSEAELQDAETRCAELFGNLGARQMEQECFSAPDDRFYAYHTLRLAVRDAPDGRVLVCPAAGHPGYRAFWVECIERGTAHKVPLSTMWLTGEEAPRGTFVAIGKAPSAMLRFATGHGQRSNSLWPLTTESAVAQERSKVALASNDWDDAEQKLSGLIHAVLGTQS
jgi:type VI secretion system ImpM family protein